MFNLGRKGRCTLTPEVRGEGVREVRRVVGERSLDVLKAHLRKGRLLKGKERPLRKENPPKERKPVKGNLGFFQQLFFEK